jgi:hypothetical protein
MAARARLGTPQQPGEGEGETAGEDDAGRNPHQHPAELLVLQRGQSPGVGGQGVRRVERASGEGDQRAEQAHLAGGA